MSHFRTKSLTYMDDLLITSPINSICFKLRMKESLSRIEDKSEISEKQVKARNENCN